MLFAADGMLGNIAKWLRLAGYDTFYFNTRRKTEIISAARKEGRIILTCDRRIFEENSDISVLVESTGTVSQLGEIKKKLNMEVNPELFFTRCSLCNIILENKRKNDIMNLVPEHVCASRDEFKQCPSCKRIYWSGDHCKAIRDTLKEL
jgi:hypothetical protein